MRKWPVNMGRGAKWSASIDRPIGEDTFWRTNGLGKIIKIGRGKRINGICK